MVDGDGPRDALHGHVAGPGEDLGPRCPAPGAQQRVEGVAVEQRRVVELRHGDAHLLGVAVAEHLGRDILDPRRELGEVGVEVV